MESLIQVRWITPNPPEDTDNSQDIDQRFDKYGANQKFMLMAPTNDVSLPELHSSNIA